MFDGGYIDREAIEIPLSSNYKNKIEPTNPMRKNEYVETMLIPKLIENTHAYVIIQNKIEITFRVHYVMNRFFLRINLYGTDEHGDIEINKKNLDNDLIQDIAKHAIQYIEELNNTGTEFVNFTNDDSDELIQIYNGKIYGLIYDLNEDKPIEPAKLSKTKLIFKTLEYNYIIDKIKS